MSPRVFVPLLAVLALLAGSAPPAVAASAKCAALDEPLPEVDENGILLEEDKSTDAERAEDYDDSAEDGEIPEDEGQEMTAEERAALAKCLEQSSEDAAAAAADAFDAAFDASKSLLLGTFGSDELPYGGKVEFTLQTGGGATTARASKARRTMLGKSKLSLRSGDSKALKFRLNAKGRKLLNRKGRIVAVGKLKLTDALTKQSKTTTVKVVLKAKK